MFLPGWYCLWESVCAYHHSVGRGVGAFLSIEAGAFALELETQTAYTSPAQSRGTKKARPRGSSPFS